MSGSYYRGNGPGGLFRFGYLAKAEGASLLRNIANAYANTGPNASVPGSGLFVPHNITDATPFAQPFDLNLPRRNTKTGEWGGRTSHPAVGPGGFLFTWGHDFCYEAVQGEALQLECDRDIMLANKDIVLDPKTDAKCIVCDDRYHDLDAQWVAPYEKRFGVPFPVVEPLAGDHCRMEVENALMNELYNVPDYPARAKKIRWTPYTLHTSIPTDKGLGTPGVPIDAFIQPDGGMAVNVPCNTPLLFQALDAMNKPFVHDPMLHSLRPGETLSCIGCHAGHSEEWWNK